MTPDSATSPTVLHTDTTSTTHLASLLGGGRDPPGKPFSEDTRVTMDLLVACTNSAALNLCNRDEVAVRPRDARLVQVPHVRLGVVRDSAACQDRVPL